MDTQNKYISILLHMNILGIRDWLYVDIGGLMDGTKEHTPEKGRSIGQGNTELS